MKQYDSFSADDFACDEDFLRWVKYPEKHPELVAFWDDFRRQNPEKADLMDEARHLIEAVIHERQYFAGANRQGAVWERIYHDVYPEKHKSQSIWSSWYSKAAAIVIAVGAGWFVASEFDGDIDAVGVDEMRVIGSEAKPGFVRQINNSDFPKTIILSDHTSIVLQPHGILEYPETFADDTREVYLTGEGFFEVAHDANRPFLVKADEIVTRVLGTSFIVRNIQGEDNVLVQVKKGKVSVFRSEIHAGSSPQVTSADGVVLMANQQVLYERDQMKMTKSLVENPSVLIPLKKHEFEFVDTPISDVFDAIEQAYGVDIVFDEAALSACYLNASLTGVPLYEKLRLICKGINATYEIIDSHIIIYGRGCSQEILNPKP